MSRLRILLLAAVLGAATGAVYAQVPPAKQGSGVIGWLQAIYNGGINGVGASGMAGYPPGSTPQGASATGTTAGTGASLPAVLGQYTYLCGFSVSPGSATAAITLTVSLSTVTVLGAATWSVGAPATNIGITGAVLTQTFSPCIRTNVVNQNPGISVSALGTGGVNQAVSVWGYSQ